ncbi:MAG: pentapeptide repeat-containing protein [Micromonosporaceae bacterium]
MEARTVHDLTVLLPGEDPDELDLAHQPPRTGETVARQCVTGSAWARASIHDAVVTNSWLINADLSAARFARITFDRCVLRGCSLVGTHLAESAFKNVIFENCRLDYATVDNARSAGPVAFIDCSFTETDLRQCSLRHSVFTGCRLDATSFGDCDLRDADLRENDLTQLSGAVSLRGAILAEEQLPALTEALVRDLELKIRKS